MKKNYLFILVLFLFAFGLYSCTDKNKELFNPNLDGSFDFSLSQKGYSIEEMVQRTSQIKLDSSSLLLKFETDEIKKDTSIQNFVADVFMELTKDTTFTAKSYDTLSVESIVGRDSVEIMEADITNGTITYSITNYTSNPVEFKLYFLGFTKQSGGTLDTLNISFIAPPSAGIPYNKTIALDGYGYKVPPNQPFQSFIKGFWIKGILTFGGKTPGDSIHVFAKVSNISFNRIKGRFKPVPVGGNRSQIFVNSLSKNMSEFIKGVTFDSVEVSIKAASTIKDLDIQLKKFSVNGVFKDGRPETILSFKDNNGNWNNYLDTLITSSKITYFKFNKTNTNIDQFITSAPDSIRINTQLVLNPNYKVGEIRSSDSINLSFIALAWSKWGITNATFHDSTEIEIGSMDRPKFDRAKEGNIKIDVISNIPLKAELIAYVVDSNRSTIMVNGKPLFLTKNSANDSILTMNAANVDIEGRVISPATTNIILPMNKDELAAMKNAYFIKQQYTVNTSYNTPTTQVVYISYKQDVKISISGSLKLILTSDDIK